MTTPPNESSAAQANTEEGPKQGDTVLPASAAGYKFGSTQWLSDALVPIAKTLDEMGFSLAAAHVANASIHLRDKQSAAGPESAPQVDTPTHIDYDAKEPTPYQPPATVDTPRTVSDDPARCHYCGKYLDVDQSELEHSLSACQAELRAANDNQGWLRTQRDVAEEKLKNVTLSKELLSAGNRELYNRIEARDKTIDLIRIDNEKLDNDKAVAESRLAELEKQLTIRNEDPPSLR